MLWHLLHQIIQVVERISAISPGRFDQREHCNHSFRSLYGETKQTVLAVKRHRFHTAFRNPVVNRNASVCQETSQIHLLVQRKMNLVFQFLTEQRIFQINAAGLLGTGTLCPKETQDYSLTI